LASRETNGSNGSDYPKKKTFAEIKISEGGETRKGKLLAGGGNDVSSSEKQEERKGESRRTPQNELGRC